MDIWANVIQMLSALAVVLVLMGGLALAARRWLGYRRAAPEAPLIQVVGACSLGPRTSIVLVSAAGDLFVVGVTPQTLVPLGHISDPERIQRLIGRHTASLECEGANPVSSVERKPW
jgi:flagellar biogenesis protein FliO